jgi:hypothetical protein
MHIHRTMNSRAQRFAITRGAATVFIPPGTRTGCNKSEKGDIHDDYY